MAQTPDQKSRSSGTVVLIICKHCVPRSIDSVTSMRVSFLHRQPIEGFYSIESYFAQIRHALADLNIDQETHICPWPSQGLLKRLRIIQYAGRHQADVVHVTGDIHFAALGTDPARTIVTVHDCGRLHQLRGIKREVLRQFWFALPLRRVAAVTVTSQAVRDDLLSWVPDLDPQRIHLVPVCIASDFKDSPQPFHHQKPRILQVGTAPNKNIARLAQALQGIVCTLVIIGRISKELQQCLDDNKIEVENYRDLSHPDVVEQYRKADLIAFVSTFEGFGMPILEAQAVGRAVVTSNCTSMPDVAGGAAELVDPFSITSMRAGLLRVINDPSHRGMLIERGRENIKRFNASTIARQYLQVYEGVLGAKPCA